MKVNIDRKNKNPDIPRKFEIVIEDHDVRDYYILGEVILKWLKKFRETPKYGFPGFLLEYNSTEKEYATGQLAFDFYKESDVHGEFHHDEWMKIIDKMIWSFEEAVHSTNGECYYDVIGQVDSEQNAHPLTLKWKVAPVINRYKMIEYYEKIQEGLDLFAKYFRELWD